MLVVQVLLTATAKASHFYASGIEFEAGEKVIVETDRGPEFGEVVRASYESADFDRPAMGKLRRVIRRANPEDEAHVQGKVSLEDEGYDYCRERIRERGLPMALVKCEPALDGRKAVFFFTAEGRVDFRELVKDLAQKFRIRIEMRQIGARDAARVKGGFGHCGRPLCCSTWLRDFAPVSIKMAKSQGLSMNPTKISGMCGRLMCCLKYEVGEGGGTAKAGGCGSGGACGPGGGCGSKGAGEGGGQPVDAAPGGQDQPGEPPAGEAGPGGGEHPSGEPGSPLN